MAKLNKEPMNRSAKEPKEPFWVGLVNKFKNKDAEQEEMTFATKHKRGREMDKKKIGLYFVLGLVIVSTLGSLALPLVQQLQASKPKQETQNKTLDESLKKLESNKKDVGTKAVGEDIQKTEASSDKKDDTTESKKDDKKDEVKATDTQETINKKVQEELEKATAKVVEEYNKKLEDATKNIQDANSENAKLKGEKEALQKQVEELKQKASQAQTLRPSSGTSSSGSDDRVNIPD